MKCLVIGLFAAGLSGGATALALLIIALICEAFESKPLKYLVAGSMACLVLAVLVIVVTGAYNDCLQRLH